MFDLLDHTLYLINYSIPTFFTVMIYPLIFIHLEFSNNIRQILAIIFTSCSQLLQHDAVIHTPIPVVTTPITVPVVAEPRKRLLDLIR